MIIYEKYQYNKFLKNNSNNDDGTMKDVINFPQNKKHTQ